jgi:outer membrane phospholipase A
VKKIHTVTVKSAWRWIAGLFTSLALFAALSPAMGEDLTSVFIAPPGPLSAGNHESLWLYCMNESSNEVDRTFPAQVDGSLLTLSGAVLSKLVLKANNGGGLRIAPRSFVKVEYLWDVPLTNGTFNLEISNYNVVAVTIRQNPAPVASAKPASNSPSPPRATPDQSSLPPEFREFLADHLSTYEPIYFILGTFPAAEFQFSVKYQVFTYTNALKYTLNHLYFGYTQTSFWDVLSSDPRFYDTSYKPSVFLYYTNVLDGCTNDCFHLDLQGGTEHESNGQGGATERSLFTGYLQPTATFELPDHFEFMLQPRARFFYWVGENNPDIASYRGYADLLSALTWRDPNTSERIQFAAKFRIGDAGKHVGLLYDLRFNLTDLPILWGFNPTIQVQYFSGYGQTLLQYNQVSHDFRAGICLWY